MSYAAAASVGGVPSPLLIPASNNTNNRKNNGTPKKKPSTPPIAERLLACLNNNYDLQLMGRDGVQVPALKVALASASPVLERMLYGDFSESNKNMIQIMGDECSSKALEALVEYCCSDQLTYTRWDDTHTCKSNAAMISDLVSVAKMGHTYAIYGLQDAAQDYLLQRLQDDPSLACFILEGAHPISTPELHEAAMETIRAMPYVALKSSTSTFENNSSENNSNSHNHEKSASSPPQQPRHDTSNSCGGIACLSPEKLEEVLQDQHISAEEFFLFQCLMDWRYHNEEHYDPTTLMEICQRVVRHFRLAYMDPQDLKETVRSCGFVSPELLLEAFMEQACAASKEGIHFSAFRGGPENRCGHVLVQGAGFQGCNGMYRERKDDVSNPPVLYYVKPDRRNNVTYYLIKDRAESWKICENTTALYEWKAYNNQRTRPQRQHNSNDDFPQTGWSLPSAAGGLPSAKVKLPVPTCTFFRPRQEDTTTSKNAIPSQPLSHSLYPHLL